LRRARACRLVRQGESLDGEVAAFVGPQRRRQPAHAARQRTQLLGAVFVAVLGVDGFAGAEFDGLAGHFHLLPLRARQVHLDAMPLAVVEGMMLE
jgi:hypothetical protein